MTDMIIPSCWSCLSGFHAECFDRTTEELCCCARRDSTSEVDGVGPRILNPSEITDIKSTGRKRAAMLYPIFPGMVCEWAGLRYAGGGAVPIVGCDGTTIVDVKGGSDGHRQGDRHHGPNKSTLENSPDNLHRVCATCHSWWHAMNDKHYPKQRPGADKPFLPVDDYYLHDRITQATPEELELSAEWWETRSENRPEYPFDLPPEDRLVVSSFETTEPDDLDI